MTAAKKVQDSDKKDAAAQIANAKQLPRAYYCRHMFAGVAGYENETILVDVDTLKKMVRSFEGKPVYVYHQDVDLDKLGEEMAGVVSDCFYNELDGWLWAKFVVTTDEGHEAIAKGWSVSNAYVPLAWGEGGTQHNVPYNRKVLDAQFTHLAIVPNPRYELADIFTPEEYRQYQNERRNELKEIQNSKPKGNKIMLKLFKNTRQEVDAKEIDENTILEITNDKGAKQEITIKDMAAAVLKNSEDADKKKAEEEEKQNMDSEVQVGDEKMPLKELVNRYNAMIKKNADDAEEEKKNAEEKADKEAAEKKAEEEKKENEKIAEEEKKNAAKFEELKNASEKTPVAVAVQTIHNKIALGKSRYSLKN